jgi:hypothetical protein
MKQKIAHDIQELLLKFETEYPELYTSLDEDPISLKGVANKPVTMDDLKSYLESLQQKLEHYKKMH